MSVFDKLGGELYRYSTVVVFEESAHFPYIEETVRYLDVVNQFLRERGG